MDPRRGRGWRHPAPADGRHRGRLCYPILVHRRRTGERRSFCEDHSAEPIAAAPVPLTAPIILNWDNLNGHRSFALRACGPPFPRPVRP